jgi:hypothetical protein
MQKVNPDELKEMRDDLDNFIRDHRDALNHEPRILNPVKEARDAAATKYRDVKELRP